ncbi:MAG: hypothetical protein ACPLTQ_13070 [Anaerolineae bacterium]
MPDRVPANCPHCGKQNIYDLAELAEEQTVAKTVFRAFRPPPIPEAREYVVTCRYCHQTFKICVGRIDNPAC